MLFFQYLILSVVSFLGLFLGISLVRIAPEERKPGIKYFRIMQNLFFSFAVIFLLLYLKINIIISAVISFIVFFTLFLRKSTNDFRKSAFLYMFLGLVLFFSKENQNLFLIESFVIVLFGMVSGSILYDKKNYFEVVYKNSLFFAAAILPFLFSYF